MTSGNPLDNPLPRLVFGLAFAAAGALILALAPHRTLTCAHAARPPAIAACLTAEAASGDENHVGEDFAAPAACTLPPDMQCRLQAKIVGVIPTEDARVDGIREFVLLEDRVKRRVTAKRSRSRGAAVDRTLLFLVAEERRVDLGWHAKTFATPEHHDRLLALAKKPAAARIELIDRRKVPLVAGFVMLALGALIVFGALTARR